MKVKIIKCSSDLSWYLDNIGQVFNVYDYNKEFYGISNDPKNRLISRENAISVYDGSDDLEYLQKEIKLDLETLKSIKASFSLCSDESARCNGYANLCETIEKMEKKKDERVNFFDAVNKSFNNIFDELPTYKQDPEEEKIYNEKKERQIFKDERLMKKYFKYREVFDEILNELKDKAVI